MTITLTFRVSWSSVKWYRGGSSKWHERPTSRAHCFPFHLTERQWVYVVSSVVLIGYMERLKTGCGVPVLCGFVCLVSWFEVFETEIYYGAQLVSNLWSSCLHHQVWGFRCMPQCPETGWIFILIVFQNPGSILWRQAPWESPTSVEKAPRLGMESMPKYQPSSLSS